MAPTQANRPLRVTTPLGPDKLLPVDFGGTDALSELFQFSLTALAENATKVEFDKLIGQPVLVELDLPGGKKRHFHGICNRLAEGKRDNTFTHYKIDIVPKFWLLTRRCQSRIFQQTTIPDLLKEVLAGLDVTWDLKGKYPERDYVVQYRESDFHFASRLMEEEGIYYYFTHSDKGHTMVVADAPDGHVAAPVESKAIYEEVRGGTRDDMRVTSWLKVQELGSGKVTLWDHCFELPQQNLEAQNTIQESVAVGKVTHKLKVADNDQLEVYDYPGAFSEWFDGVDPGGGDQAGQLEKIFAENARITKIRMEQEAASAVEIRGGSNCRQFTSGHKFTLEKHFNADGPYVLTRVTHTARLSADYRSGEGESVAYENHFTCVPLALPYRPPQKTPQPMVGGSQTATVVGPPGELMYCDKYGRIKIQFHWDRQGKKDAKSSCWVRVSQNWGGAKWGGMFIPHVGQEVIVDFEEGDPDRPLVTGRVYNAEAMPPLELPANKTLSIIRDYSANEIKMQGEPGKESIRMFSPHANSVFKIGAPNEAFAGFFFKTDQEWNEFVTANKRQEVDGNIVTKTLGSSSSHTEGTVDASIHGNSNYYLKGSYICRVDGTQEYSTRGHYITKVFGANWVTILGADTDIYMSAQQVLNTGTQFELQLSKKLFKTPDEGSTVMRVRQAFVDAKADVTRQWDKFGTYKQKIMGTYVAEAPKKEEKIDMYKASIGDLVIGGSKGVYNIGKWVVKGTSAKVNSALEALKKVKFPNFKDKG